MLNKVRDWFGFSGFDQPLNAGHGHSHGNEGDHGHTHGLIDPSIASTERGVWAVKWSFVILAVTAAIQFAVVLISGSVALLADMIHNVGDANTAIPLLIAFVLARRKPSKTFTYGLGRAEDLAGILIVLIILFSAVVAGYQAISRLLHPQPVEQLGWLAVAGVIGFIGNEVVAVFRIRVGRQMNSAALIADGFHARTDGITSLAVVLGAAGVWLGFSLADPIIGLLITVAIFGIVWQSSRAVITRMLDGVDPVVVNELQHAAEHVPGISKVLDAKARWLGHELHADLTIAVDDDLSLAEANKIASVLEHELREHLPALATANIRFGRSGEAASALVEAHAEHHHAPDPVPVHGELAQGVLEIIDTPTGERMRFHASALADNAVVSVMIDRREGYEELTLLPAADIALLFLSTAAPAEPHEFNARLLIRAAGREESLPFRMTEPAGHAH